ncbi:hypothetical protein Mro03_13140 [Microbispora rosea subsp. rosea]|nr:hypothetical protein Mro03_13140 [Microbispora rosea subsp. rosea]
MDAGFAAALFVRAASPERLVEQPLLREPVPDWLADRLIFTVGMSREDVAALDLQQAVDLWAEFRSSPR